VPINARPPRLCHGCGKPGHIQKNCPASGGKRPRAAAQNADLTAAFADLQAQEKGARDALVEISADRDEAAKAVVYLTRDLKESTRKVEIYEASIEAAHKKWANAFEATWSEDAPKSYLYLWCLVPALLFWALILWVNLEDFLADLEWVIDHDDARIQFAVLCQIVYCMCTWWAVDRYLTSCGKRNLLSPRIRHCYAAVCLTDYLHDDLRADSMSMTEIKHANAIYGLVEYTIRLNGRLINKDYWGELTNRPGQMLISMELLAQLSTPTCMQSTDELTTQKRLESFAKSHHAVNLDKYLSWKKHDVVGNTTTVALGIWKDRLEHRVGYFPSTLVG